MYNYFFRTNMWNIKELLILFFLLTTLEARKHNLQVSNDGRKYISLSTFGFYKGGSLHVSLINFRAQKLDTIQAPLFGFTLDKTLNDAMSPYLDTHQEQCLLKEKFHSEKEAAIIYFTFNLTTKLVHVNCSDEWVHPVHIYNNTEEIPKGLIAQSEAGYNNRLKRQLEQTHEINKVSDSCKALKLPITSVTRTDGVYYNTTFAMFIASESEEGLYNLYFHSCPSYESDDVLYDFTMEIFEVNRDNYLSAGEMPLPALYCTMGVLFFLSGCFWVFLLRQSRHPVYNIHYLMAVLVFLKSLSLAFHGVNYHFIQTLGVHLATWAVLFYIAHLLKGAFLFVTLILVGTGWTFIKHVLAPRDKRLFMAVIPLQVLANVAEIILEESEEGAREHNTWRDVFIFVDLLCCGCILFPVVWSIRHLQEASRTDGKAAVNLRKLKLFRHFYVMIVCYIYFTRIIVYLLRLTVPFQYGWLDEMFREMATYVFFVLTGYKFRPAAHNPYFSVPSDEEDDEDEVLTETGMTEALSKITSRTNATKKTVPTLMEVTEEESDNLLKKESSHEYD